MQLLPKLMPRDDAKQRAESERAMLNMEAKIGGQLFGPVPAGHTRKFFCLDDNTWIWYEAWKAKGKQYSVTTRYDVRPNGVLKSQNGQFYQRLSLAEARNLYRAAELYEQKVGDEYRRMLQAA